MFTSVTTLATLLTELGLIEILLAKKNTPTSFAPGFPIPNMASSK